MSEHMSREHVQVDVLLGFMSDETLIGTQWFYSAPGFQVTFPKPSCDTHRPIQRGERAVAYSRTLRPAPGRQYGLVIIHPALPSRSTLLSRHQKTWSWPPPSSTTMWGSSGTCPSASSTTSQTCLMTLSWSLQHTGTYFRAKQYNLCISHSDFWIFTFPVDPGRLISTRTPTM